MNWNSQPATEGQPSPGAGLGQPPQGSAPSSPPETSAHPHREISIGKKRVLNQENGQETESEVFTMSLGVETIELLPLRNWGQLDTHKWTVRGKLPGTPAGLDIALDHVKMLGETASIKEPDGCSKLETLFNDWLALERENQELARKKAQPKQGPAARVSSGPQEPQGARFRVEQDKQGQVRIHYLQGKESVAEIGLNMPGFSGLFSQGLMRKPRKMQVGVLHDWVELDGELFSFEKGKNDAAKLEQRLNEKYRPDAAVGRGKDVVLFANAASSTGFDIQFPVTQAGVLESRRRPLNEDSLALLQEPIACGLLHKEIVIKLTRPNLVFKQKTPDGGERYLERSPEHTVTVTSDDGGAKVIDLSQPVSYFRLNPIELTAVFNHPAINRHSQAAPPQTAHEPAVAALSAAAPASTVETPGPRPSEPAREEAPSAPPAPAIASAPPSDFGPSDFGFHSAPPAPTLVSAPGPQAAEAPREPVNAETSPSAIASKAAPEPAGDKGIASAVPARPSPNAWLEKVLAQPPIRHDWLACMVYNKIVERFGNSRDGTLGLSRCWSVALDETEDIADPAFKGIFLTEKHGLGFMCREQMARFNHGVAFLGTQESALQGIGVVLLGAGFDVHQRLVLVITDDYRKRFGVPEQALAQEVGRLAECGAVILSAKELLQSQDPIEVLWTVPAEQENSENPQTTESIRPEDEPGPH
ncbi:MAG TPA: hypothetical protein VN829_12525 [Dongiaceae bacterium]|nr:hypothetical protein [Dongiaceae bacterium]